MLTCCGLAVPDAKLKKSSYLIVIVQSAFKLSGLLLIIFPFFKSATEFKRIID